MELLNPLMLWGALAIAVPIIIHFWHQKKGKVIDWAATNWLIEKNLQQSRGIRLDNIFLLILRCLLLLILSLLLSKPLLHALNSHQVAHKVHLVQKNSFVVNNYKFELEEALKKGEKCYWFNTPLEPVTDFNQISKNEKIDGITIQNSLNQLSELIDNEQINMYFVNAATLRDLPHIFVPNTFSIHSLTDSSQQQTNPYLAFADNKKVFIGSNKLLTATSDNIANGTVKHTGLIKVLLENNDDSEKQHIKASLTALSQTYQLAFQLSEKAEDNVSYDIVFSNHPLKKGLTNNTLYFFSNTNKWEVVAPQSNQILIPDLLNPQKTEMVYNGLLPEFLGEKIIQHFELQNEYKSLSHQQLNSLFKAQKYFKALSNGWFPKSLLLIFILLLALERWIAIYKNS